MVVVKVPCVVVSAEVELGCVVVDPVATILVVEGAVDSGPVVAGGAVVVGPVVVDPVAGPAVVDPVAGPDVEGTVVVDTVTRHKRFVLYLVMVLSH